MASVDEKKDRRFWDSAAEKEEARLFDLVNGQQLGAPLGHPATVQALAVSPDAKTVLTAGSDNVLRVWKVSGDSSHVRPLPGGLLLALSPDGTLAAIAENFLGPARAGVQLRDVATGKAVGEPLCTWTARSRTLRVGPDEWPSAVFSADGGVLVTATGEGQVQVWDVRTHQPIGVLLPQKIVAAALSKDGRLLWTVGIDLKARLWDTATGQSRGVPLQLENQLAAVGLSPDGRVVLTATNSPSSGSGEVRRWDSQDGRLLGEPLHHPGRITALAFAEDGTSFVTVGGLVRRWDSETGKPLLDLVRPQEDVRSVRFSPDGTKLLTTDADHSIRLWDARTGLPFGGPVRHTGFILHAGFAGDGKSVFAIIGPDARASPGLAIRPEALLDALMSDKHIHQWPIPSPVEGSVERIKLWVQVITGLEVDAAGGMRFLDDKEVQSRGEKLAKLGGSPLH